MNLWNSSMRSKWKFKPKSSLSIKISSKYGRRSVRSNNKPNTVRIWLMLSISWRKLRLIFKSFGTINSFKWRHQGLDHLTKIENLYLEKIVGRRRILEVLSWDFKLRSKRKKPKRKQLRKWNSSNLLLPRPHSESPHNKNHLCRSKAWASSNKIQENRRGRGTVTLCLTIALRFTGGWVRTTTKHPFLASLIS